MLKHNSIVLLDKEWKTSTVVKETTYKDTNLKQKNLSFKLLDGAWLCEVEDNGVGMVDHASVDPAGCQVV